MKFFATSFASPGKSVASITGISEANLSGFKILEQKYDGSNTVYIGWWTSGTLTLSTYNAFPVGSIIYDCVGFTFNLKVDATTWKSETLS